MFYINDVKRRKLPVITEGVEYVPRHNPEYYRHVRMLINPPPDYTPPTELYPARRYRFVRNEDGSEDVEIRWLTVNQLQGVRIELEASGYCLESNTNQRENSLDLEDNNSDSDDNRTTRSQPQQIQQFIQRVVNQRLGPQYSSQGRLIICPQHRRHLELLINAHIYQNNSESSEQPGAINRHQSPIQIGPGLLQPYGTVPVTLRPMLRSRPNEYHFVFCPFCQQFQPAFGLGLQRCVRVYPRYPPNYHQQQFRQQQNRSQQFHSGVFTQQFRPRIPWQQFRPRASTLQFRLRNSSQQIRSVVASGDQSVRPSIRSEQQPFIPRYPFAGAWPQFNSRLRHQFR